MSEIRVPGQPQVNPLLVLATAIDKTNQHLTGMQVSLREISRNTRPEERHIYALALRPDGSWGSYCLACSDEEAAYVHPCKRGGDHPVPPSHIYDLNDEVPDIPSTLAGFADVNPDGPEHED